MSLFNFDGSPLFSFVASPLFARNQVAPNMGHFIVIASQDNQSFPSLENAIFPPVRPEFPAYRTPVVFEIGQREARPIQPGWNRASVLAWGIDNVCNPFVEPYNETHPIDSVLTPGKLYDDTSEIFFQLQNNVDRIIRNRDYSSPSFEPSEYRIPINCVRPSDSFTKSVELQQFLRVIEFSVFNPNTVNEVFKLENLGISYRFRNWGVPAPGFPNSFIRSISQTVGTKNTALINPLNPMLFNGVQERLFDRVGFIGTGIGVTTLSVAPDTQHRAPVYTDSSPLT